MTSISEIRLNEPVDFASVEACPACGFDRRFDQEYHGVRCETSYDGFRIDVHQFGQGETPHLHITCPGCGFTFISKVSNP